MKLWYHGLWQSGWQSCCAPARRPTLMQSRPALPHLCTKRMMAVRLAFRALAASRHASNALRVRRMLSLSTARIITAVARWRACTQQLACNLSELARGCFLCNLLCTETQTSTDRTCKKVILGAAANRPKVSVQGPASDSFDSQMLRRKPEKALPSWRTCVYCLHAEKAEACSPTTCLSMHFSSTSTRCRRRWLVCFCQLRSDTRSSSVASAWCLLLMAARTPRMWAVCSRQACGQSNSRGAAEADGPICSTRTVLGKERTTNER